ncbi:MAG TPA: peptidoglycan bridge formation glycyltransferase FemA/FemB family protein, partial [Candidatus Binatia bacterium]|nr:peptidoglycan bridge formation glycyltransferase FemA/FemB family protein [Candidatus Binatia bacterium]
MVRKALDKIGMQGDYQVALSTTTNDPEWDAFLSQTRGSDLLQSSLWSQLKETVGWRVLRLVLRQEACIVGGAQILVRPLPFPLRAVGYVPRGPIL